MIVIIALFNKRYFFQKDFEFDVYKFYVLINEYSYIART